MEVNFEKIFDLISKKFIDTMNNILDIHHRIGKQLPLKDKLSQILLLIRQIFICDIFVGAQALADKKLFISLCILSRSLLDITSQLNWLINLELNKKEKALDLFTKNFNGIAKNKKNKPVYKWQHILAPNFNERQAAALLGDNEFISFDIKKIIQIINSDNFEEIELSNNEELKLTFFDYLSKITHWNPIILRKLVGISDENEMGFQENEYLRAEIIGMLTIVNCTVFFTEIFCKHFSENEHTEYIELLKELTAHFVKFIAKQCGSTEQVF